MPPTDYNNSFKRRGLPISGGVSEPQRTIITESPSVQTTVGSTIKQTINDTFRYLWDNIIEISLLKLLDGIIVGAKDQLIWNGKPNEKPATNKTPMLMQSSTKKTNSRPKVSEVSIRTKLQTIEILEEIDKFIDEHGAIAKANVYEMLNKKLDKNVSILPSDWDFGWTSIDGFDGRMYDGEWFLVVPPSIDIRDY